MAVGRFSIFLKGSAISLSAIVSIVAGLASLPNTLKLAIVAPFSAVFFLLLGSLLQSAHIADHRIMSWHVSRIRGNARDFLETVVGREARRGRPIHIDCMGIKLETVSDFMHSTASQDHWKNAQVRFLLLRTGSEGAKAREAIEVRPRIDLSTEKGLSEARHVKALLTKRWPQMQFIIKRFSFLPAFYIVRINDSMLVGLYLRQKGRDCPYLLLEAGPDSFLSQFQEYFDTIFDAHPEEEEGGAGK